MSKESAIGWILVAFCLIMEVAFKLLGIDSTALDALQTLLGVGFAYIGLKGISANRGGPQA